MAEVRQLEIPKFKPEEEAEFGSLQRAFAEICEALGVHRMTADAIRTIMERLVREALGRAKPNRRMAYLEQFRDFLCPLPDEIRRTDESGRARFVRFRVEDFRLKDAKGRKNASASNPAKAGWRKVLLEKGGELWEAEIPDAVDDPGSVTYVNLEEWKRFMASETIHHGNAPASTVDRSKAKFLRPLNQASVLLREFESLYPHISKLQNLRSEDVRERFFPDVPIRRFREWMEGRTPAASDLALLVAAYRAKLTATSGNLSTLREWQAGAQWAKHKAEKA